MCRQRDSYNGSGGTHYICMAALDYPTTEHLIQVAQEDFPRPRSLCGKRVLLNCDFPPYGELLRQVCVLACLRISELKSGQQGYIRVVYVYLLLALARVGYFHPIWSLGSQEPDSLIFQWKQIIHNPETWKNNPLSSLQSIRPL